MAAVVAPFIREPHGNPILGKAPNLLDQTIIELAGPFAVQEGDDLVPAGQELCAVAPAAVLRIGERHTLGVAAVPGILGEARFLGGGRSGERGQRRAARHRAFGGWMDRAMCTIWYTSAYLLSSTLRFVGTIVSRRLRHGGRDLS